MILNRVQRPGADGDPVWGALDTYRHYQNVVAAATLHTRTMTTEVCETLGLAIVPREVTPGLRPVMEIAGVPEDLINWSASRLQGIEDAPEVLTDQYVKDHGHLPGERGRHALGWWAAQETGPRRRIRSRSYSCSRGGGPPRSSASASSSSAVPIVGTPYLSNGCCPLRPPRHRRSVRPPLPGSTTPAISCPEETTHSVCPGPRRRHGHLPGLVLLFSAARR